MFNQHYESMFDTYESTNRQKLEQILPQLITKYKDSPDWGESIVESNRQHHHIEDSHYLSRKYKSGIGWADYKITTGDERYLLEPQERYTPLFQEFQRGIEQDKALLDSGFDENIVNNISQFT